MSGLDNLKAVAATLGGVSAKRYDAILETVGLKGREKDRVRTYSLGMKQRLGLAIALLQDPEMLILDEPANGLDPAGIVEMRDLMHRLASEGKTVLISSHLLTEVQQICSRVAIINFGKLITETTIEDLTGDMANLKFGLNVHRMPYSSSSNSRGAGALISMQKVLLLHLHHKAVAVTSIYSWARRVLCLTLLRRPRMILSKFSYN